MNGAGAATAKSKGERVEPAESREMGARGGGGCGSYRLLEVVNIIQNSNENNITIIIIPAAINKRPFFQNIELFLT